MDAWCLSPMNSATPTIMCTTQLLHLRTPKDRNHRQPLCQILNTRYEDMAKNSLMPLLGQLFTSTNTEKCKVIVVVSFHSSFSIYS